MDLTVIGAGVAGSALTREARSRGHHVKLISNGRSASEIALAVVRETYVGTYPGGRALCRRSMELYREAGAEVIVGAMVSSYSGEPHERGDWNAVLPSSYLLEPDERATVNEGWIDPDADAVIWATGAALDGQRTFGATWEHNDPDALKVQFAIHQYAPYRTADAVRFSSGCRVGSSSSTTLEGATKGAHDIARIARERGWLNRTEGWTLRTGLRVKREQLVSQEGERTTFGGFHRVGWALAPAYAELLVDRLETDLAARLPAAAAAPYR